MKSKILHILIFIIFLPQAKAQNFVCDSIYVDTKNISTSIAVISFENAPDSKFALDNYLEYYKTVNIIENGNIYEHIHANQYKDSRYDVAWKLVPVGETDVLKVNVENIKLENFDIAKVIFQTKEGTEYNFDKQTYKLTLPSSADNNVQEIYALYNLGKGDFRMLGKLNVVSYKKQQPKVKVIFVNNYSRLQKNVQFNRLKC
jgi:hypothetical protein